MRLAAVVAALVIGAGLLWGAGEFHYRNCVEAAKARGAPEGSAEAILHRQPTTAKLVDGCSRLPW